MFSRTPHPPKYVSVMPADWEWSKTVYQPADSRPDMRPEPPTHVHQTLLFLLGSAVFWLALVIFIVH
jgi:hypothetical protein